MNSGTLTIKNGTLKAFEGSRYLILNENVMTVDGVTLVPADPSNPNAISNAGNADKRVELTIKSNTDMDNFVVNNWYGNMHVGENTYNNNALYTVSNTDGTWTVTPKTN